MPGLADLITQTAQAQGVDPRLALEVAVQESGLDPNARGAAGEIGLFQLEPATAAQLGVDPTDVGQNISGGIAYLKQQLDRFGSAPAALAAYNWGPERVAQAMAKYGPSGPSGDTWFAHIPGSTQAYVSAILTRVARAYSVSVQPAAILETLTSPAAPQAVEQMVRQAASVNAAPLLALALAAFGIYLLADYFS